MAAGGAVFLALVHDRRPDEARLLARVVAAAAVLGAVATLVSMPVQGVLATGLGAAAIVDLATLADVLESEFGISVWFG